MCKAKVWYFFFSVKCACSGVTLQSSWSTIIQTLTCVCNDRVLYPSQLSPCCSPIVGWWTSWRQSSPPPLHHPPLHQPALLWPCCAVAIYCCLPLLLCSTFTALRYTLLLSLALITAPRLNSAKSRSSHRTNSRAYSHMLGWNIKQLPLFERYQSMTFAWKMKHCLFCLHCRDDRFLLAANLVPILLCFWFPLLSFSNI